MNTKNILIPLLLPGVIFCCSVNERNGEPIGEDSNSIVGKVICGYQGWFNCEGDGADLGWKHYSNKGKFEPGICSIDFWPDMSEMSAEEKFKTPFRMADGNAAPVFSSRHPLTVDRHFSWMKEYGIDGVFVQRFVSNVKREKKYFNLNQIPRLKGDFLWGQFASAISADVEMIYVAMFDEMDEGTCIFKCSNDPPVGESPFCTYEGLPADHYLWLTGTATIMLRKEMEFQVEKPVYK